MSDKIMYWMSVLFGGLSLLLFIADTALISGNRQLQSEVAARQTEIDKATRLTPLNQNLAQALAEAAVKSNDKDIRDLLASQGIEIRKPDKAKDEGAATPKNK